MIRPIHSYNFENSALSGYYIGVRVGFAFPVAEHNAFPAEWISTYTREGLMLHDPLMKWVYSSIGACRWSDMDISDDHKIMDRAAKYGLRFGAGICCVDRNGSGQRSFGLFARADREFTDEEIEYFFTSVTELHLTAQAPTNLTDAELEVLRMLRDGMLIKQIAAQLEISQGAVKQRLKNAKQKLDARTSNHAMALAMEYGLI